MRLQHVTRTKKHSQERIHLDFIHLDSNDRLVDRYFEGTHDNLGQNTATFYIFIRCIENSRSRILYPKPMIKLNHCFGQISCQHHANTSLRSLETYTNEENVLLSIASPL